MAVNAFGDPIDDTASARVNAFGDSIEGGAPAGTVGHEDDDKPYTPGSASKPSRAKKGTFLQRALMGTADLATGAGKLGSYILAPVDLAADAAQGRPLGTGHRERMGAINDFGEAQGATDWTSVVNQAAPEVIATGGPMAKVEQIVAKEVAKRVLPKAVEKLAPKAAGIAADTGTNMAYSGAQAAAEGDDPWEAAKRAALIGLGVRGAVGAVAAPFKKGANQAADKNAKYLKDQGFSVTPGMLFPDTWAAGAETVARNTPFVGGSVERAEGRLGREYISRYGQEAVDPLLRVVPGHTSVGAPPVPATPNPQVAPQRALPRATGREVGPSMVEPLPNRYPMPDDGVLHVDSQGNVGQLPHRNPAYDPAPAGMNPEGGTFYSTQAGRPADAANLPATQMDTSIPRPPPPGVDVGPARRPIPDEVLGEGTSRRAAPGEPPPRGPGETFEQVMTTEKRAPKVEGEGLDLVRNIQGHIDDAYNDVVEHTFMKADDGISALLHSSNDMSNLSWLTAPQQRMVKKFINDRMIPALKDMPKGSVLSGRQVKNLDTMLGEQARKFADDATTRPMSEALYAVQNRLRVATDATSPAHRHALQAANEAHRKMLPLMRATEQSLGGAGIPSSVQLRAAMDHYGFKPDALNDAMVQVAPNAPSSNQVNRRWVGSGLGLAGLMSGGLPAVGGLLATGLGAGAVGRAMYSPAGVKTQIALLNIPAAAKRMVEKLPYQDQIKYLSTYAGQAGARLGDNQGEENAP